MVESVSLKDDEVAADAVDGVHADHVLGASINVGWAVRVRVIVAAMRTSPRQVRHGLFDGSEGRAVSLGQLARAGTVHVERREDDVVLGGHLFFCFSSRALLPSTGNKVAENKRKSRFIFKRIRKLRRIRALRPISPLSGFTL